MFIGTWKLDPWSSLIAMIMTTVLLPVGNAVLLTVKKHLKSWVILGLETILIAASRSLKLGVAAPIVLKKYCRLRLAEENKFLYVPSKLAVKLETDTLFVPITLEGQDTRRASFTHQTLLFVGNRLRVIGDPGSGKSTLVKRLFRDACKEAIKKPRNSRLPVLFELKTLREPGKLSKEKLGSWLLDQLKETTKVQPFTKEDLFDVYSKGPGVLVLLDGLDEVSSEMFPKIREALNYLHIALAKLTDRNVIVLTMRTQFHQQIKEYFRSSFGTAYLITPFTPSDVYEFLTRWPFQRHGNQQIARIYKELTDRPTLREMCSNPLVLSMYVAQDQISEQIVAPESRTEFYRQVTGELLFERRLGQTGTTQAHRKLREQRENILGLLAYRHMLDPAQPANTLNWTDAIQVIESVTKYKGDKAEIYFSELQKETGLVTEERPRETFRFIHLTFCEFFAAYEAIDGQKNGWEVLVGAHRSFGQHSDRQLRSRLVEVIPFAAGLIKRVDRYKAIDDLVNLGDPALLTRAFLETKLYDHKKWAEFVESEKTALLSTPEDRWDASWLRRLHLFNVVIRDAAQNAGYLSQQVAPFDMESFFLSLKQQQSDSLSKLVSAYAEQDPAAAFGLAELSNLSLAEHFPKVVIKHCDQKPFLALVVENAQRDADPLASSWAPLLAKAALYSRVVAKELRIIPAKQEWHRLLDALPKKRRWMNKRYLEPSFYSQCLTIAANSAVSQKDLMLLAFSRIPPPGRIPSWYDFVSMLVSYCLVVPLCYGIVAIFSNIFTWFLPGFKDASGPQVLILIGLVPAVLGNAIAFHAVAIRRRYQKVILEDDEYDRKPLALLPFRIIPLPIPKISAILSDTEWTLCRTRFGRQLSSSTEFFFEERTRSRSFFV